MDTIPPNRAGGASAIAAAAAYLICLLAVLVLPASLTTAVARDIFHGFVTQVPQITLRSAITGTLLIAAGAWFFAVIFASAYNRLSRSR